MNVMRSSRLFRVSLFLENGSILMIWGCFRIVSNVIRSHYCCRRHTMHGSMVFSRDSIFPTPQQSGCLYVCSVVSISRDLVIILRDLVIICLDANTYFLSGANVLSKMCEIITRSREKITRSREIMTRSREIITISLDYFMFVRGPNVLS